VQSSSHRLLVFARTARRKLKVNMQRVRLKLLTDLEAMFDMAKAHATDKSGKAKQRQIWTRISAYIGQVMNSLATTFDEAAVTRDLEELERMIHEAMAKKKNPRAQKRASAASGN
jgi:hypothetical protein